MRERLQKVLAAHGVASRRGAEAMIADGRVTVNGVLAATGQAVDPTVDAIAVDGRPLVTDEGRIYVALNKPTGFVSSRRSTHGEQTVLDLISVRERIYPVGRLDMDTSGLLLMTNDGEWANKLTHPRYEIEKEYRALVRGRPSAESLEQLRRGVTLPDGSVTAPARVELLGEFKGNSRFSVTVIEGKKRQIRLMGAAVGHPVLALKRVRVGSILLGDLDEGRWRHLRAEEIRSVYAHARRDSRGSPPHLSPDRD